MCRKLFIGKFTFCFIFSSISLHLFATEQDTLFIKPGVYEPDLRKFYVFQKGTLNEEVATALKELRSGQFKKNTKDVVLNEHITESPYWIALNIKNDTTIDFPITWNFYEDGIAFSVYNITDAAAPRLIASYSTATSTEKRGLGVRCVSFKVMLPRGQTVKLLAKCQITTASQMYIPTDITTTEDILQYEMEYGLLVGRYFGFFLFALLFNLLVWTFTKKSIYLFQFFYILSISLFNLIELLFDAMILPPWLHQIVVLIPKNTFLALSIFFAINVFEQFTDLKINDSKTFLLLHWLKYFVVSLVFLFVTPLLFFKCNAPFVLSVRNTSTILTLISYLGFILFILVGCFKKNILYVLYLLSALPILLGFISFVLNGYFRFKIFHIEPGNLMVGLGAELLFQTLFFSYRYRFLNLNIKKLAVEKLEIEKNVSHSIIEAQEIERVKISEDLHDQLGNDFIGLKMLVERIARINEEKGLPIDDGAIVETKKLINDMTVSIRYITHTLAQISMEEKGLVALIDDRIALMNTSEILKFYFEYKGNLEMLTNIAQVSIFRIVLEAMNNIIKHSKASEASISLKIDDTNIVLTIKDNGTGFSPNKNSKGGFGLYTMQARTEAMKGAFDIFSEKGGNGTIISAIIPSHYHINKITEHKR